MAKITPRTWIFIVVGLMAIAIAVLSFRAAASGTLIVSGNTSTGTNSPGWLFNNGVSNAAPYSFSFEALAIGSGSLKVGPLSDSNLFVAEFFPGQVLAADFSSFSYDYRLGSGRNASDAQFVIASVYTNIDNSGNDFDCRFDYTAKAGSTSLFGKEVIMVSQPPTTPTVKNGNRFEGNCPDIISAMPAGSYVRAIKLTVGTDSTADVGLTAYFDNVEFVIGSDATNYNFEPAPQTTQDCDGKKWMQYNFKNQGQCMQFVTKGKTSR